MYTDELPKFAADGMIHTVRPQELPRGRRDLHQKTTNTRAEALVCLTCPLEECEGDAKCFRARKKLLEEKK